VAVRNADALIAALEKLKRDERAGIGRALAQSVVQLDAYARQKIQSGGRSGRVYRRRGIAHQASAPGEFPKTDRGQLVASLYFRVAANKLSAFFGTKLNYGRYLEYGTSRMRARPWLAPTLKANAGVIRKRMTDAVAEAIRKGQRRG
jgi:HK97 gp10 family phage protein